MAGNNEIREEYMSSLADLTFNSKPLISVLTILAEENIAHAKDIVEAIETHLSRVNIKVKLPVLYLIDCIIKNVGRNYTTLFCQNIVATFCGVFEQVDERTRAEMFKLRQTWNEVIPPKKLYALDVQIAQLDPAWPVTAPPPKSIHFNPKFLKTTSTTVTSTVPAVTKTQANPLITNTNTNSLDTKTLTMQQKLITKQRELLELQQRKLELELLQTQVKLQEQLKTNTTTTTGGGSTAPTTLSSSQNVLLKPEVAKQLSQTNTTSDGVVRNVKSKNLSHTLNARSQSTTGSTRTAPTNTRAIRDPRLMRHLQQQAQQQQQQQQQQHHENVSTTINSVLVENKLKAGNQVSLDSENKIVNNKSNVRNDRIEHRLVNNKGNIESHGKSKTSPNSSSPLKHTQKIGGSRKNVKSKLFSNETTTNMAQIKSSDIKNKSETKNTSRSNLKFKKKISSSNASSSNNNGSSICTMRFEKDAGTSSRLFKDAPPASSSLDKNSNLGRYDKSDSSIKNGGEKKSSDKHANKSIKSGKDKSHHKSDPAFFKDLKGSTKNRNYIRRNQNAPPPLCGSPESNQDVDLRVVGLPEKQPRLPGDIIDDKNAIPDPTSQPMDVDLRQIPATIVAGKKRPSIDNSDSPNAKKSKSEVFDVLFGREDTDLRQLPSVLSERPQTPPPPIISEKVITIRDDDPPEAMEVDKAKLSNFNAIRAKLANAVIQESEELQLNKKINLDMDMRRLSDSSHEQILISEDEEAIIRANKMTIDQQKSIANKIVTQIETQKLREAQRKESESMSSNTSLQPISDDEFEAEFEFSSSDSDNAKKDGNYKKKAKTKRDPIQSRIPPLIPQNQLDETYNKFNRAADFRNDPRRGRNWRGGRHRQKVWETNPPQFVHPLRPPIEQWARPPANEAWRPNPFEGRQSNISPHLLDQRSQSPNNKFQDNPTLQFVHPDSYKFITIDGEPREIRYYDETAIVFLSAGDPREISFQNGSRRISFDGEIYELHFNEPYQEINVRGRMHRVRLGGPSREIFMDGRGYQCYFDSIEKTIDLDGNTIVVKLEPPPPQVSIGQEKRLDLVAGKIQLIVDAKNMFTVFLDSKVQTFEVDGMKHSLKFIEGLRAVLIDEVRFEVEYGGLPKPVKLQNRKYFVRFSVLPDGIKPGQVALRDMDSGAFQRESENSQESTGVRQSRFTPIVERHSPERNSNSPSFFQNFIRNPNLDMLSSVMASSLIPSASESSYKVENDEAPQPEQPVVPDVAAAAQEQKPGLNINELFQRLVATGIVGTANKPQAPEPPPPIVRPTPPPPAPKTVTKNFVPIYFDKPETLKSRHSLRFSVLTMGMQCSSCGMRFPPEDTIRYSQHLDWHFRQNRKGKKNLRAAPGRPWYYSKSDWNNYTEIEDLEEREKSYFENQSQSQVEGGKEEVDEEEEIPCVASDPNVQVPICDVCHDRFEQFFNEENEEWQLRKAIRVDDRVYHPLCYEDYQASMEKSLSEEESVTIPGLETTSDNVADDDEDDDDDNKKKEEEDEVMEVIDNIDDESPLPDEKEQGKEEEEEEVGEEEEDDDVILNEVVPEKIIVDDDDKDDYVANDHGLIPGVVVKVEPIDDGFVDVEDGVLKLKSDEVKIKSEPGTEDEMDDDRALDLGDDIMEIREVPEHAAPTHTEVLSSIDGNLEFESGVTPVSTGLNTKIKINITKPLPAVVTKDIKDVANDDLKNETVDPSQPLPPGEEPVQLNVKPSLRGVSLKRQPVVRKGVELSGLCSIM